MEIKEELHNDYMQIKKTRDQSNLPQLNLKSYAE